MSMQTLTAAGIDLCHGVPVAPTMQRYQQPVSQDLLARVFWEFQHVDTVERRKKTEGWTWSTRWNTVVMTSAETQTDPKQKPAAIEMTCCTLGHAETSPCFLTLSCQTVSEETHCPLVLTNICQTYLYWLGLFTP